MRLSGVRSSPKDHVEDDDDVDDLRLLRRYHAQGKMAAFEQLVEGHQTSLLRLATAVLCDADGAKDVVQEAFVRLADKAGELLTGNGDGQSTCVAAWLRTVVRHRCIDLRRQRREQPGGVDEATRPPAPDPVAADDTSACLWREVDRLPPLQRAAVVLRYRDGLSYQQIALNLDRTVNHVGVLLHEALGRLRQSQVLRTEVGA